MRNYLSLLLEERIILNLFTFLHHKEDNEGHNEDLMKACPLLGEYAYYVATVRENKKTMSTKEAVEKAIQHCIKNGVLAEGKDEGRAEGDSLRVISLIIKKVQKSKTLEVIADELECEPEEIQKFYDVIKSRGVDSSAEEVLEEVSAGR